jgi:hypothetical protein
MSDPLPQDTPSADIEQQRRAADRRVLVWMLWIFGFVIVAGAFAFGWKIYEFAADLLDHEGLRFAGSHLLTYVLVAGGFFMLLLFCFLRGHFADIEKPKYDLLDMEKDYDVREFA